MIRIHLMAAKPILKEPNKSLATSYVMLPDLQHEKIGIMDSL